MMMPPAGSILNVNGSSNAMVAAGPRPGMIPTIVPSRQPMKHQSTLTGCSATANPCSKPEVASMSESEEAGRELDVERHREHQMEGERGYDRRDAGGQQRPAEHPGDDEERQQREAEHESERGHQRNRERKCRPSPERPPGRGPIERPLFRLTRSRLRPSHGVANKDQGQSR